MKEFNDMLQQERATEEILLSDQHPETKVKNMMAMGIDQDDAEEMVSNYQVGQMAPVYYERLEFDETNDLEP